MPIIRQGRFCPPDAPCAGFDPAARETEIEVSSDTDPAALVPHLEWLRFVTILFPSPADGRGFSIAARLRDEGFEGTLRAKGHILADQYPLALRCGFDEVEITAELAARIPEQQWLDAFARVTHNYQDRLRGSVDHQSVAA